MAHPYIVLSFSNFMLFHLVEPDYKTQAPHDVVTRFYGRSSEQILSALEYYHQRGNGVDIDKDKLVWWMKKKFTDVDIEEVDNGKFHFVSGMLSMPTTEEERKQSLFEELKVADDFSVYVPKENIEMFGIWRGGINDMERGGLYKLQNPIDAFMNLSFVPEDVATAVRTYDLAQHREAIEHSNAKRAELSRQPNINLR